MKAQSAPAPRTYPMKNDLKCLEVVISDSENSYNHNKREASEPTGFELDINNSESHSNLPEPPHAA